MCEKIKILYEDADILVCVKPAGTASETRKSGEQDMVSLLRNYRAGKGEEAYIGLVHRLDQPVEGILVFGKDRETAAALSRQLTQGAFRKCYLAVAQGHMACKEGAALDYLKKDPRSNTSYIVTAKDAQAKKAELRYRVLETVRSGGEESNLVEIKLLTGRHHQIRVQFSHLGAPLAGDRKYGGPPGQGLALCAYRLEFTHPKSKEQMQFAIAPSLAVFQKFGSCPKK